MSKAEAATAPKMEPVESSNLHSVGWHEGALFVRFKAAGGVPGKMYRYATASREHYDGLMAAASPGSYFLDRLRHFHKGDLVAE